MGSCRACALLLLVVACSGGGGSQGSSQPLLTDTQRRIQWCATDGLHDWKHYVQLLVDIARSDEPTPSLFIGGVFYTVEGGDGEGLWVGLPKAVSVHTLFDHVELEVTRQPDGRVRVTGLVQLTPYLPCDWRLSGFSVFFDPDDVVFRPSGTATAVWFETRVSSLSSRRDTATGTLRFRGDGSVDFELDYDSDAGERGQFEFTAWLF